MTTSVQPERILKELAGLWAGMSKGESQGTNSGVLRACAMTLVVAAESDSDSIHVSGLVAELMHEHPSRAVLLRPSADGGVMEARVFAQCWMPFGKRQQICCEQIEITASKDRLDEVPGAILGIMVPDLPVVLWARGREWLSAPEFQRVLPLVHKLIIDSATLGADPSMAFSLMRTLQAATTHVGDLTWTRLTARRQAIAHLLEDSALLPRLKSVEEIHVEYGEHPIAGAYLAGWLQSCLPQARATLERRKGDVSLAWLTGPDLKVSMELGALLKIGLDGKEYTTVLPVPGECELMREELRILEADTVYATAFEIAEQLIKGGERA